MINASILPLVIALPILVVVIALPCIYCIIIRRKGVYSAYISISKFRLVVSNNLLHFVHPISLIPLRWLNCTRTNIGCGRNKQTSKLSTIKYDEFKIRSGGTRYHSFGPISQPTSIQPVTTWPRRWRERAWIFNHLISTKGLIHTS